MNTIYTKSKAWRVGLMTALSALLLFCGTATFAQTTYGPFSASPGISAPDDGYNGTLAGTSMASSGIAVSGVAGTAIDISVNVNMNHTWVGDIVLKLGAPDGSLLTLVSRPGYAETVDDGTGCCGTNADWLGSTLTFTDAGATDGELLNTPFTGTYFPNAGATASVGSFAALFGGTMNGTWTLYVGDAGTDDFGTLNSWSITIVAAAPSFTLSKTVAVEGGNGDCSDDVVAVTDNITVAPGTGVCYWYTATNTGDVAFDLIDFVDDQLLPGGLFSSPGFDLAVGSALAIPWDAAPTVINSTVTNIVDITYYNSTLGLSAGPVSDNATVNVNTAPANDLCGNAIALNCGSSVVGTTVGATNTGNNVNLDCFELADDQTVWYSFVGTGADIELSTCGPVTAGSDEAFIAVYDGTCGAFNCITNNGINNPDPSCGTGLSQLVSFTSVQGVTYYISVAAYPGGEIDFNLALSCVCTADGGTTTAGASPVCLTGGSAVVSATADGNQVVPVGYVTGYALTQNGIVQQVGASPSFTVTAAGTYIIHTFVYDPNTINPATAIGLPAATVNSLLVQGGGTICAGLDLVGATVVVDLCVSIAEAVENGMEVYPNPSNGQFVVEVRGVEADVQIIVTDLAGRQVYSEGVTINGSFRKELNLNVAKGSYLLQIATLDGSVTRKIFID
jgi:subtilisin-like proprotein convertase family protein